MENRVNSQSRKAMAKSIPNSGGQRSINKNGARMDHSVDQCANYPRTFPMANLICFAVVYRHKPSKLGSFAVMNQAIKDEHTHETPAGRKLFFADLCRQLVKKVDSPQFTDRALFLKIYASRQPPFKKHF